jgi:hypothetical protein
LGGEYDKTIEKIEILEDAWMQICLPEPLGEILCRGMSSVRDIEYSRRSGPWAQVYPGLVEEVCFGGATAAASRRKDPEDPADVADAGIPLRDNVNAGDQGYGSGI